MPLDALPAEFLFTITANTGERPPVVIPLAGGAMRIIVTAMSGTFEGPRLRGKINEVAGGDWVVRRADGSMALDVRLALLTDDGASIYMTYTGVGVTDADGAMKIRTAPRFETGDERYAWLNNVQGASHGTTATGSVTYDVYAL